MTEDQLWKAALSQIELRVSQGNFLTWFRDTHIRARDDATIHVETSNPFAYEWLSKKYRPLILEVIQTLDKTIEDIDISITSSSQRRRTMRHSRIIAQKTKLAPPAHSPQNQPAPVVQRKQGVQGGIPFNPKYTFDNFVVGSSNEIAHAACRAVTEKPGEAYNPLFIYGGVGLGKTHLLQAIGNALMKKNPLFAILYVASERFMNEFVEALQQHNIQEFKRRYRDVDMLIIDDVQILSGKDKTQEELFHTFNTLYSQNKQLILSSDRPPSAISAFQERLSSRLSAGMIADIKKPDYETRLAILNEKVQSRKAAVTPEALSFIAKNIQNNVRELEGALNQVIAHGELHNTQITEEYAKKILHTVLGKNQKRAVGMKDIIETVSTYYNLSSDEICGKRRNKEIVRPRQIAMYLLRKENNMSFPSIGENFGGRDHTTAMHACEKIEKLLEHDDDLIQEINFLRERIYA